MNSNDTTSILNTMDLDEINQAIDEISLWPSDDSTSSSTDVMEGTDLDEFLVEQQQVKFQRESKREGIYIIN